MALITCPECNREVSDQAKLCPHCGYKLPRTKKELSPIQKKKLALVIAGVVLVFVAIGAGYFFLSPRTVEWCCYHRISDATCTEPETCSRCGKIWGEPAGHNWQAATCTEPEKCTICGIIGSEAQGHDWRAATCTEPKTCNACGITEGRPKHHSWRSATCTKPKTCVICGLVDGVKLEHDIEDYFCKICREPFVTESDVPNILDITSMRYEVNFVGGIDQYMTFTNKFKSIDYITLKLQFFNAIGDVLTDDISGRTTASLKFTGPLEEGQTSSNQYWRACFYNSTFSGSINILEIKIEYSDGTTLILDENLSEYAVKAWR